MKHIFDASARVVALLGGPVPIDTLELFAPGVCHAILTNEFLTFSAVGNREDLSDVIYMISPTDTPLQANVAKNKASATKHEWQRDTLAAAADNSQLEGDDTTSSGYSFGSVTATVRINNTCQISYKNVLVSGTQDAVNKAGRRREIVYQLLKKSKELRRDMEFVLTQNHSLNQTPSSTVARTLRTLLQWMGDTSSPPNSGNVSRGSGGSNGSSTAAVTDGTQRALTEALVKAVIQAAWTNGGDPDLLMPGPFNKTVISGFTGNNTRIQDTSDGKLLAAIDIYVSDFGTHKVVPNKFSRDRDLPVLTSDLWAVSYLRPMQTIDLAKTGDNEKGMVLAEYTLECRNDAGSGIVADLTTS